MKKLILLLFVISLASLNLKSQIINIPDDFTTIQEGIDAANAGDTVLVQPGIYVERINFNEKNIVVASFYITTNEDNYIEQTVIDGDG